MHLIIGGKGGGTDPGNDYPAPLRLATQDSRLDPWLEYNRECTSFVAWALASRNGFTMPFHANARDWGAKARSLGYRVDSSPAPGSVAWSTAGVYGHVAYVEDVIGGSVHIEEYNHWGNGTYDSRVVPASTFTGYIHFRDLAAGPSTAAPPAAPVSAPAPAAQQGLVETTGGVTHTWSNPSTAAGAAGPDVAANQTIQVVCKVSGFTVGDGNSWWYLIASGPWSSSYYASADAFYNNGRTSGSLQGTPFVDPAVPSCPSSPQPASSPSSSSPPSTTTSPTPSPSPSPSPAPAPPPTWGETVGGVTHTWTDYGNAGGNQGPSIQTSQTVQVACKVQGFRVSDGDTWWYRIASSPWNSAYYASADAFYNNGQTSGSLHGTPFVDNNVPNC